MDEKEKNAVELQIEVIDTSTKQQLAVRSWTGKDICFKVTIRKGNAGERFLIDEGCIRKELANDEQKKPGQPHARTKMKAYASMCMILTIFCSACIAFYLQLYTISVQTVSLPVNLLKWFFFILSLILLLWKKLLHRME